MLRLFNSSSSSSLSHANSLASSLHLLLLCNSMRTSASKAGRMTYYPRPIVPPEQLLATQKQQQGSVRTRSYYFDRSEKAHAPMPKFESSDETDGDFVQQKYLKRPQPQHRVRLDTAAAAPEQRQQQQHPLSIDDVKSQLKSRPGNESETRFIDRKQREADLVSKYNDNVDKMWYSTKQHLRDQDKLVKNLGSVEAAVRETLQPSRVSFREELRRRPVDRQILEEIHRELHGLRVERHLRKGIFFEHWVSQSSTNTPVLDSSKKSRSLFGLGGKIELVAQARSMAEFPVSSAPEVAFIGKTNTGKSSLINALLNSFVCKHGALPGTTCTANFYSVASKRLMLVDLPGYGFYHPMQAPQANAENAIRVLKQYLSNGGSRNIKRVFLCSSSTGLTSGDIAYVELLEKNRIPFSVVCTKTDLVPVKQLAKTVDYTRAQLTQYKCCRELMMASSLRLAGINKVQNVLADMGKRENRVGEDGDDIGDLSGIV